MGRQIKYGHLLHGGDYNPEQWLDRRIYWKRTLSILKRQRLIRYL